jgi:acetylornithine deacetylase
VRVNPEPPPDVVRARIRATAGVDVRVIERLDPCRVAPADPLVRAAARVRPGARLYGSRAASDLAFFRGIPAIKAGPGATERSHRPDEWVGEADILEAARFYEALAIAWCGALATVRRE